MRKLAKRAASAEHSAKSDSEAEESAANGNSDISDNEVISEVSRKKNKRGKESKKAAKKRKEDSSADEVQEEYEVEKIIDSRKENGKLLYLIRWKGYSSASDTWEPESIVSCPELVTDFKEKKGGAKSPKGKTSKKKTPEKTGKKKKSSTVKKSVEDEFDYEKANPSEEYEVERILEVHHKKDGKREFLIHWKGWSTKHDSWEPEEHLHCEDLIEKFMAKVDKAKESFGPGVGASGLRVAPKRTQHFTLNSDSGTRRLSRRKSNQQRVHYYDAE